MHWTMIWTIYLKDLRDAIRDARVLVAILAPLGVGIFYSFAFDNDDDLTTTSATVVYAAMDQSSFLDALNDAVGNAVRLTFRQVGSAEEVEQAVNAQDADVGFVVPAGFDAAVQAGQHPTLQVFLPSDPSIGGRYVAASAEPATRLLAGQQPPATVAVLIPPESAADESIFEQLGIRTYMVLAAVMLLVSMVAMLVVPVVLAEEVEKKTLDALVLIASYADVIIAKAMVGLSYTAIAVGIQLAVTHLEIDNIVGFGAALLLLSVALLGIGLFLAGFFKSANQLNTWSGFFLIPIITPVFLVGAPLGRVVETILLFLPTSQGMRLIVNAVTGDQIFGNVWLSYLVILAWSALAYLLLAQQLSRRRA